MRTFKHQNSVPPGGRYFFEVPETREYFASPSQGRLLQILEQHYGANKLPCPENLWELVVDFMCRRLPAGFCNGGDPEVKVLTLDAVRERTRAVRRGRPQVDDGVAAKRAQICAACPHNDRTLCPTCVGLVDWALQLVGRQRRAEHTWLGVCALDCSAIAAKVYVDGVWCPPTETQPPECWMLKAVAAGE
ncbi:MAG TPA: hypothetical protein VM238_20720 [Phycisphaerae bacterium]|nr:hypothetical protein [Phycisphaerae bacterium]